MDQIIIDGLEVFAKHGVLEEENTLGQKFIVNAILELDLHKAGQEDHLELSVNYAEVCSHISSYMQEHTFSLIETVAEQLSVDLLQKYSLLKGIELEIRKPWAPVGLPLNYVSIKVKRSWHRAVLALGSNMGDRQEYLTQGELALDARSDCRILKSSNYIETKPYGVENQPSFLNGAVLIDTLLSPTELLEVLHRIEAGADRKRDLRWGPRTLDLDIIFYDKEIIETEDLIIPHVDMQNRDFVLKPMLEICPNYRHPIYGLTIQELYARL